MYEFLLFKLCCFNQRDGTIDLCQKRLYLQSMLNRTFLRARKCSSISVKCWKGLEEVCEECNSINPKSIFPFHIRSTAENDSTSLPFCPTPSKRGFENKKSHCWANVVIQILYPAPLKILVENSKLDVAVVLNILFENMSKVTKLPCQLLI